MKVWAAIFNVFAIMILMMLLVIYRNVTVTHEREFQEVRLAQAVQYSAEAAFLETLQVEDLDIEYSDIGAVVINPGDSLDIFESVMCLNYNMSASEENKAHIEAYVPTAVLSCNDGYYIATLSEIDTTINDSVKGKEYRLKWSVKKPYLVQIGATSYAVTLNNEDWISARSNAGALDIRTGTSYGESGGPAGLNKDAVLREVNTRINKDIAFQIDVRNFDKNSWDYKFYLPPQQTQTGVNPISRPGLLIFMQGVDFAGTQKIDVVSVAGLKTTRKIVVIGFVDGAGNRYYCYEGQLPDAMTPFVREFFSNIDEAAKANYKPHYEYLAKRIDHVQ